MEQGDFMKKMIWVVLVILLAGGLVWFGTLDQEAQDGLLEPQAQPQQTQPAGNPQETGETAPIQVVYEGVLPAADCPGIKTTLTLYTNGTFQLQEEYLERDTSFTQTGTFTIQQDLLTLTTQDNDVRYFHLGEGTASMLDADKQPITGDLASYYILRSK